MLHVTDLVFVHEMTHPRIENAFDARVEAFEHGFALDHPFLRDVAINITASEEYRRAVERYGDVVPLGGDGGW